MDLDTCTVVTAILLGVLTRSTASQDCTRQDYDACVQMADPLLRDPHLIFPDNMADVELVCRRWSQFVECVRRYTERCFTEARRQEFDKAVESPVDSVHQMCAVAQYQAEYLQYASCIKSTVTEDDRCGRHYRHLVSQVSREVARPALCCSHYRFRECVLMETKKHCDDGANGGSAARFSKQILDKALSFLRDQCLTYVPSQGECPVAPPPSDPLRRREEDGNGIQDQQHRPSDTWPYQSGGPPQQWRPRGDATTERASASPWLPGSSQSGSSWMPAGTMDSTSSSPVWIPAGEEPSSRHSSQDHTSPAMIEISSRPASYGRGVTWSSSDAPGNDWTSTWRVMSTQHTTEPWFPAVSNYEGGSNAVDEPNQQGLSNRNGARSVGALLAMLLVATTVCLYL